MFAGHQGRHGALQPGVPVLVAAGTLRRLWVLAGSKQGTKDGLLLDARHSVLHCLGDDARALIHTRYITVQAKGSPSASQVIITVK